MTLDILCSQRFALGAMICDQGLIVAPIPQGQRRSNCHSLTIQTLLNPVK